MQVEPRSFFNLASRLAKSTLLWLLALMALATLALQAFQPLAYVTYRRLEPGHVAQMAIAYKEERLNQIPRAPEVMLLGSSLVMAAVKYCDGSYDRSREASWDRKARKLGVNAFQSYDQATYLEDRLQALQGAPVTIFNFSCAACMASDAYLILDHAQEMAKAPKLVIYGMAPRDFADNLVPEMGETPAFSVLADWQSFGSTLVPKMTFSDVRETMISAFWPFYKGRTNFRLLAEDFAAKFLGHPASLAEAEHKSAQVADLAQAQDGLPALSSWTNAAQLPQGPRLTPDHLHDYQRRYNPQNDKRFDQEVLQFKRLLQLCRDRGITLVVVNMPITNINKEMIPSGLLRRYNQEVCTLPEKYGAHFLDLEASGNLKLNDFLDSVHTNPKGGKKILDALVFYLGQKHLLDGVVCSR